MAATAAEAGGAARGEAAAGRGGGAGARNRAQQDAASTRRERRNWMIHQLYLRHEYRECLAEAARQRGEAGGAEGEFPVRVRALIRRHQGEIEESLRLFQQASAMNPHSVANLRQVGRSLYLLGKHRQALEVFDEAQALSDDDWETWHNKGLCFVFLKNLDKAVECFQQANSIQRHDGTFLQLGRVLAMRGRLREAAEVYVEALDFSPENPELLTAAGLLHLREGDVGRAFEYLGAALARNPRDSKTILAAGSVMQDHGDVRPAMVKYRVAAACDPNSAQLWNNVGMGFFALGKHVAAAACLKRSLYLNPFEWIVSYNLGLVHLAARQYASAFHHLSASINRHPGHAPAYTCLAVALGRLGDPNNAFQAYEKAVQVDPAEPATHLNYAVTLLRHGHARRAAARLLEFDRAWAAADAETKEEDPEVPKRAGQLREALRAAGGGGGGGKAAAAAGAAGGDGGSGSSSSGSDGSDSDGSDSGG